MPDPEISLSRRLRELSMNLFWSWQPDVAELFRALNGDLWEKTHHNPVAMLKQMSEAEIELRGSDAYLNTRILYAHRRLREYLESDGPLGGLHAGPLNAAPVAYFSAEFGIHECLPIYSGGLGILSGDHLKAASDMDAPLVAVGLLYAHGYFHQWIDTDGIQKERYEANELENLPIRPALSPDGKPIRVTLPMPGRSLTIKVWEVAVGRVRLFLLDTDAPENNADDRILTDRLYGGDEEKRLKQEMVLGIGGLRALREAGIRPVVLHLNEGHCAFALLERARERVQEDGLDFHRAWVETNRQSCFTTHTPVPAGHDRFHADMMEAYLGWMRESLLLDRAGFLGLGRVEPQNEGETFCMTVLCLKGSLRHNAVSNLHGRVSREMWQRLWPNRAVDEIPIGHVTNGVHLPTWMSPVMQRLFERELGRDWELGLAGAELRGKIDNIADGELWETHMLLKRNLVAFVRAALLTQAATRGEKDPKVDDVLDPNFLTIGFSRRFATYKRATLIFEDMDRLRAMLLDPQRPIQLIFAGKAHPKDDPGKRLIKQIFDLSRDPQLRKRLVFVEDYDIGIARQLVRGVDLWLNNPERPLEACGTSGMKVALNGGLNCSILDGWWDEAYDGLNGFAIGGAMVHSDSSVQRGRDAQGLYQALAEQVIPAYYERGGNGTPHAWVRRMKRSMQSLVWRYGAARMVGDYMERFYLPAAGAPSSAD